MTDSTTYEPLARKAYDAYGASTGGKNFRGEPMPTWNDLGETIQTAWIAASRAAVFVSLDGGRLNFGQALTALKAGLRVARQGWNGRGMWLALQLPDEHSKMRRPYLYMAPVDGDLVPWVASQSDLLAADWQIV